MDEDKFETAYKERHANCKKPDPSKAPVANPDGRGGDGTRFAKVFMMQSDKNGDGKIDRSEFRGQPMGFDRLDKNKNGFVGVFAGWRRKRSQSVLASGSSSLRRT